MDDMDDERAFWRHHAEAFCPQGNPLNVWDELLLIAAQTPERFREAVQAAATAVGARYCDHGDSPPGPLPDIRKLAERQAAAQQHAGLCGKFHAEHIANIDVAKVEERAAGTEITTKRMRNQVCWYRYVLQVLCHNFRTAVARKSVGFSLVVSCWVQARSVV